jgi:hypothetical protein
MATSERAGRRPRHGFLFSRNRLNVAVSRAQALAVVVCSPALLSATCTTVQDMALGEHGCAASPTRRAGARPRRAGRADPGQGAVTTAPAARAKRPARDLDALGERRRLQHLEVHPQHADPHREPVQVVVARAVLAPPGVERGQRPPQVRRAARASADACRTTRAL